MATTCVLGTLDDIPDDFGVDYLLASISLKKKQKAHAFISGSYIESLKIYIEREEFVCLRGEVHPSQRKSDPCHIVSMEISKVEKKLTESHCKCQQGYDGSCSHVVAILYLIEQWKIAGYKEVPAMLSSTSLPQQWDKPRGAKVTAEPVSKMVISRPTNLSRKRRPVMADFHDNRKKDISEDDIAGRKRLRNSSISYLVDRASPKCVPTPFGLQSPGSALSYHGPLIDFIPQPRDVSRCGNLQLPLDVFVDEECGVLLSENEAEWNELNITHEEALALERKTRKQNNSKVWHEERRLRITASSFGAVMTRKKAVNFSFLNNTFNKKQFSSKPTTYGHANESVAKAIYIKRTGTHMHDIGLVVNPKFPFLGASPDATICVDGQTGLIEVKCPYSARHMTIKEAINQIKDFCLYFNGENAELKYSHVYSFQVQGQLLVSGAPFCDFVVYTKLDFFIQRIYPDKNVMSSLLKTLCKTYVEHFKPFRSINK